MSSLKQATSDGSDPTRKDILQPLTPQYVESEHRDYVDRLHDAFNDVDKGCTNVALSGSYGTGKSSILEKFREEEDDDGNTSISVSVLTLEESQNSYDPTFNGNTAKKLEAELQMEITKRFLYSAKPDKLANSRFRRLNNLSKTKRYAWSVVGPLVILALIVSGLYLVDYFPKEGPFWPSLALGILIFMALSVSFWNLYGLLNKASFERIGFKGIDLDFSSQQEKYFDEYLDEIENFFAQTGTRIVVFEDLDRFNNPGIFESLRELNGVLNVALTARKKKNVQFVYAIRDSIFSNHGKPPNYKRDSGESTPTVDEKLSENVGDERAKLFDLIIPVVPFMTQQSSYEHVVKLFKEFEIDEDVLRVVANHVTDMRLLRGIRNEYIVFADVLFKPEGIQGTLNPSQLLAVVTYKCMYPDNFELISRGRSTLDTIYEKSREIVNNGLRDIAQAISTKSEQLRIQESAAKIAKLRGQRLQEHFELLKNRTGQSLTQALPEGYSSNSGFKHDQLTSTEFWSKCDAMTTNREFRLGSITYTLTADELREICGSDTFDSPLDKEFMEQLQFDIDFYSEHREWLEQANMKKLALHSSVQPTPHFLKVEIDSFQSLLSKNKLIKDLISRGLIDQNFSLYASVFPGKELTTNALNYRVHYIQRNKSDYSFKLTSKEVESLFRVEGTGFLAGSSGMNINIVDHISQTKGTNESRFLLIIFYQGFMASPDYYLEFLNIYLKEAEHPRQLVQLLASKWGGMPELIATSNTMQRERKIELINLLLPRLKPELDYEEPEEFVEMVSTDPKVFSNLSDTNADLSQGHAASMMETLAKLGVVFEQLADLNETTRQLAIKHSMYVPTAKNYGIITGNPQDLSLDSIKNQSEQAYENCVANLESYLEALTENGQMHQTVKNPDSFCTIINDLTNVECDPDDILKLALNAAPECRVENIEDIDQAVRPIVAESARINATVSNILAYFPENESGSDFDSELEALAYWLEGAEIIDAEDSEQDDRQKVAGLIATATIEPLTPSHATHLIKSLGLTDNIEIELLQDADNSILPELLQKNLISDTVESFQLFNETNWNSLERALAESKSAPTFDTYSFVHDNHIQPLYASEKIPAAIKTKMWQELANGTRDPSIGGMLAAAEYALKSKLDVRQEHLNAALAVHIDPRTLTSLIASGGKDLSDTELRELLGKLESPWNQLQTPGGQHFYVQSNTVDTSFLELIRKKNVAKKRQTKNGIRITPQ